MNEIATVALLKARIEELEAVLEPFVTLADERDARYRQRGGEPDKFPDTAKFYGDFASNELPTIGHFRRARSVLGREV